MKRMIISAGIALFIMSAQAGDFISQQLSKSINIGEIIDKTHKLAVQIPTNVSAPQIAQEAVNAIRENLKNIPHDLLGINISQVDQALLQTENATFRQQTLNSVKSAIKNNKDEAIDILNKVNAFIKPGRIHLVLGLISGLGLPMIRQYEPQVLAGLHIADRIQQLIDVLQNNITEVESIASVIYNYTSDLEQKIANLQISASSTLDDVKNQLETVMSPQAIETKVEQIIPLVQRFILAHQDQIVGLIQELKKIQPAQIGQLISSMQGAQQTVRAYASGA